MKDGLCRRCVHWVKCRPIKSSFCLAKDLFTHTDKGKDECCIDFVAGKPLQEAEYENYNCIKH